MMQQSQDHIGRALDLLTEGLAPYVEGKLRQIYRDNWVRAVNGSFRDDRGRVKGKTVDWDAHALLTVMWDQWNSVFRHDLGHYERSLVSELREFRNRWAHQADMDFDDVYRVTDSVRRLLQAVDAANLPEVQRRKEELLESHVAEEVNTQIARTAFNRNRWWVIGIYSLCCSVIIWHMLTRGINSAGFAVSVVILVFIYLIYQNFKMEPPLLYGPRECSRCGKIIYRHSCPYCQPAGKPALAETAA